MLPLPAACPAQSEIELVRFSAQPTAAAPEDAPQRTAFWEMEWAENGSVSVEFSYVQTALYTNPLVPPEKRRTKTNIVKLTADTPLEPSGLLGPVRLLRPVR